MPNLIPRLEFLAQALVRRRQRCPHCGSLESPVVARKHVVVRVRCCARCRLCFTDPIYDRSLLGPLYGRRYAAEGSTTALPDPARLAELTASDFAGTDKDARARLEVLRGLAPGPRLLEVGSSWGYVLWQARAAGFEPVGVEPSEHRRRFGRRELGVEILAGLARVPPRRFDVVYTAHTLEHFTRLEGTFDALFDLLEPGGLLALEVPNVDLGVRGRAALTQVGAVHPLGLSSAFLERALPAAGFALRGLYERWEDLPERPVERSRGDVVLALAQRPRAADAASSRAPSAPEAA